MKQLRAIRNTGASGFTLAEVLITLLIMGGILLSMTQLLTAARTSRDTVHNIQEARLAGPAIMDRIERDLRGLLTYNIADTQYLRVNNRVTMGLDADSIDFIATTDSMSLHAEFDRYVRTDINEVGYRLKPAAEGDDFLEIYRREDAGIDDEPWDGGNYVFLHDRVKAFDIQVFTEDGEDAEPIEEWGDEATNEDYQRGLPTRLEISLTLELAPRITNEQIRVVPADRRTVTYRRVIRLPESLRMAMAEMPVPMIPAPASGGDDTEDDPNNGTSGDGRTTDDQLFGNDEESGGDTTTLPNPR